MLVFTASPAGGCKKNQTGRLYEKNIGIYSYIYYSDPFGSVRFGCGRRYQRCKLDEQR